MQPLVRSLGPRVLPAPKIADALYLSPEWRSLMVQIKRDRGARCEDCGSTHRVAGDHVVEVKDGGAPLDPKNVRLRCQACHNAKTAKAKAARARR